MRTNQPGFRPELDVSRGVQRPIASITLDVDPDPELVRLARLVVSGIASVTPMGLEDVEDCRAAVDEMCSTLLEVGVADAPMHLELRSDGTVLEVSGRLPIVPGAEIDEVRRELSEMILDAVTDEHRLDLDDGLGEFAFSRAVRAGGGSG